MIAGIDVATGDGVVCMDADLQHPPEVIPDIIAKFDEGYDVISMVRRANKSAGLIKNITSNGFYGSNSYSSTPRPTATPRMTATPNIAKTSPPDYITVTEPPAGSDYIVLRMGDSGEPVKRLQQALKEKGYYKDSVSGNYGKNTHNGILQFQQDHGLRATGIADRATQRNLFEGDYPDES